MYLNHHTISSSRKNILSSLVTLLFMVAVSVFPIAAQQTYNSAGPFIYNVPVGVTLLKVECWGAGGGGSNITFDGNMAGGGGGGGAYASSLVPVTQSSYTLTVGGGGGGGASGGDSYFNTSVVIARGGSGASLNTAAGAAGGLASASVGTVKWSGGNGATGVTGSYSGGGGGGAGSFADGANSTNRTGGTGGSLNGGSGANGRTNTSAGAGRTGSDFGGAGSGGYATSTTDRSGGAGAGGLVIVTPCLVEVNATSGVTLDYYPTVKAAVDAINNGVHQGIISIKLLSSTTETATISLNASTNGSALYTSVILYPTTTGLSISGSIAGPLFTFNGCGNVTIDGRVNATGSTVSLNMTNTNTGTSATTLLFNSTAQSNTVKYCQITGGGGSTTNGTIQFGTTGNNSSNTVSNCQITNNGTRRACAIYSNTGTNTSNSILNNEIFNTWLATTSSNVFSVYLGTGASTWTISDNSFYDTGIATMSGTFTYSAIYLNNTTNGSGFTIYNNHIGGSQALSGGAAMEMGTTTPSSSTFYPIYLNIGTANTTTLFGNEISNINYKSSAAAPFIGYNLAAGNITLNSNDLGDVTGLTPLTLAGTGTTTTTYGISLASTSVLNVLDNRISTVTLGAAPTTNTHNFTAIYKGTASGTLTVTGNVIGHASNAESIKISSTATVGIQSLYGIYSICSGTVNISNNTVANLLNATTNTTAGATGTVTGIFSSAGTNTVSANIVHDLTIANGNTSSTTPSVCGLMLSSTVSGKSITENKIYNLSNTYAAAAAINVTGLQYSGATNGTNVVEKNLIYGLSIVSASGIVRGILIASGSTTYSNNIISLSNNLNNTIYGAYDAGSNSSTCNFYHNTVYLGGTAGGTASSYALYSATASNTRNFRNNILFNARSSTGTNYAIYYNATGVGNLTADYNDYRVTGTNGMVGYYPSSDRTLSTLQTALAEDANSIDTDPGLHLAGGVLATDYQTHLNLIGVSAGITVDYGSATRSSFTMGAWEFQPVEIWSNNTLRASFGNLKSAFDKINDGTWTGDLTVKITASTNETASAVLNASEPGGANYSQILIYPEASDIVISGNINAPLISLNGADKVFINGSVYLNNTSPGMVLMNTNTGNNASVVKFSESAQNNSIKYCYLKGNSLTASQAVVLFATSTTGTGNSTDTIAYCKLSGTGSTASTRPRNVIFSNATAIRQNTNILITGNEFYDFLNPDYASNGILVMSSTTAMTVSENSFYETTAFVSNLAVDYKIINIDNLSGGNFSVTGNYIGGNAAYCSGTWTKTGNGNLFDAIFLNVGSAPASGVHGNTIKGFNYTNAPYSNWLGIHIAGGNVDVGTVAGNTLGETTGTGSITLTNTATSGGNFYGIYVESMGTTNCQNNMLGSISVGTNDNTLSMNFYGIYKAAVSGSITISNNQVGGETTENSLIARSLASDNVQDVFGIYSASTDTATINGNTVANLVNATTSTSQVSMTRGIMTVSGSNTIDNNTVHHISTLNAQQNNYNNATLIGIEQISEQAASTQLIRGNKVYSLKNITSATIEMYGIFFKGPAAGTHEISRNFVHTFIIVSTDAAYLHGISLHTGTYTCSNNVVFLGDTITTGCRIWGIWNNSNSTVKIYHNTVYLNGKATTGSSNSFAFRDLSLAPTNRDVRNNIFWNERINTVTPIAHYAFFLNAIDNTTLNYNDYQFAQKFALVEGTTYSTQQEWVNATPFDDNSISTNPLLTNLGGISPSDYQPGVALVGEAIAGQTTDFGGAPRGAPPTMGAWEYVSDPVEVWNGSTHQQDYKTLKLAFDAINAGTWTGDLTIKIKSNIKETVKAVLYQTGYTGAGGTSSYSRVHVYPTRIDIQVSGKLPTPLIELNGAHGVVFDGRVSGTGSAYNLILQNDSISTAASTLTFLNSAEVDSVKYCIIKGLSTNPNGGIVHFSTSNAGTGNDNNCISNNKITVVDSNPIVKARVINAVYSEGTSGRENNSNCIQNNEIFDVWSQAASSYSIHVGSNSTAFTISGNSMYETTTFTPSAANTYNGIRINNAGGNGFVLSGNYIGGKAIQCQGSPLLIGTSTPANTFAVQPIYLNVGTTSATSVQGNTVKNFRLTSPNTAPFMGVYIQAGTVNMGTTSANHIGASTGIESIYLIGVAAVSSSYGVYVNSPAAVVLTNNNIGSITTNVTGSTAYGHSFYGIYKAAAAGGLTVTGNLIGSLATSNSLEALSAATANVQSVYGIYSMGTGATTLYNNTIANLRNNTTRNFASNIVDAVYFEGANGSTNNIERNFIYGLSHACATADAVNRMTGIYLAAGSASIANNIVWIGNGETNNFNLYGIYDQGVAGQTNTIYHNTVYMSGAASGTTKSSYAYLKAVDAGTTNIRNNIFYNARSGGSTGKHYALSLPGTTLSNVTINVNDYYTFVGGFQNYYKGSITSIGSWKTTTGQDGSALNSIPFTTPASALAINFRPTLDLPGLNAGIGYDYGLNPRSATTPTMGAWERVNKWKGSLSIDFNTASNWTFNMVPAPYDNIIFDDAPNRPCTMDQDRYVTDIVNNQATYRMVVNGFSLTIRGNLTFANGAQVDASATGSTLVFNGTTAQSIPSGSLYTNKVYNLNLNNANHVTLYGTLVLLNNFTSTVGKLNAASTGATFTYGGTAAQTIESNTFLNEKVYNLTINNPAGVTLNTTFTADNDMTIQTGSLFTIPETKGLTVTGLMTNHVGTGGLLLKSSATGTASLFQSNSGVPATVQRYIDGDTCAWHFMSSPVSNQTISGTWIPSGTFGDGTGYDLYAWDEPAACWVYNLNTTVSPTWPSSHPQTSFVPGRGYLYAVQALHPTKQFVGNLNGGTITRALTKLATPNYIGFNLLGNPYPSSLDWNASAGYDRSMLDLSGGGYYMWTWSTTANNYGVYNSADADGIGTNNVTRHIAPMQAFFVQAASAGTFAFHNAARVHDGASVWLKSAQNNAPEQNVRLSVSAAAGRDEIKVGFGYAANESGAMKLFSPVLTAPSLYMNRGGASYSTCRLTDISTNKYIPVYFKAGETGSYTLNCTYDASAMGSIFVEDRLTGTILDLSNGDSYTFQASVADAPERFILHFGAVTPVKADLQPNVWVSAGVLNVYLENMIGDYTMRVSDLQGRLITNKKMSGSEQCSVPLFGRGIYLVTVESKSNRRSIKVIY